MQSLRVAVFMAFPRAHEHTRLQHASAFSTQFSHSGGKGARGEVANSLKINDLGGKRSGPGQPIGAGPQGVGVDNVNKETT